MVVPGTEHTPTAPTEVRTTKGYHLRLVVDSPLGGGGEGVVYRTENGRFAVKVVYAGPGAEHDLDHRLKRLDWLPLEGLPISRPIDRLTAPNVGYVMDLVRDTTAIEAMCGQYTNDLADEYAAAGGLRRRLTLLARCAETLSTLHERGIVYGDVSPRNILASRGTAHTEVWFVDADNLQTETAAGARTVLTRGYGAPELVRGSSGNTPASDVFAFAVIAHGMLTTNHPFLDGGHVDTGPPELEEDALRGLLPWVGHSTDDGNRAEYGIPTAEVTTVGLRTLFARTFEEGLHDPAARPVAAEWAQELRRAVGRTVKCDCGQTSFVIDLVCRWCRLPRPRVLALPVDERFPSVGGYPSITLPRLELLQLVQAGHKTAVYARTANVALDDPDRPVLEIAWDGEDTVTTRNVSPMTLRRVPPAGGTGVAFYPGAVAHDSCRGLWSVHFGAHGTPHRILRVEQIGG
jgi:DNA-binding helix-hairpin-helix protein with protein kinase domain